VAGYADIVEGRRRASRRVAIIGAGGVGFDVAELLTAGDPADGHLSDGRTDDPAIAAFRDEWGIDAGYAGRGGLKPAHESPPPRQLWLLQRKESKVGAGLAKTTGWIRRTLLKRRDVVMIAGVEYDRIDDAGLHIRVAGEPRTLDVDTVVICAGQEPRRELVAELEAAGIRHRLIGGADIALELDAQRAIDQGTRIALAL
ncbi:MAG: NADPH-dependent 2,4-dienoyl-CoA reductase, partial [Casimicrobiaceae bacterium]